MIEVQRESVITCPACGHTGRLGLDEGVRQEVAWCPVCGAKLTPGPDGCCVPCVYGTVPCPPVQRARVLARTPEQFWELVELEDEEEE